MFINAVLLVQL